MKNSHSPLPRSGRPGAAAMSTDDESGAEGLPEAEDRRRALYALKVMHERGLLPDDEYARRVKELGGEG
ncbi:hypothetical protein [Indioceanicola profundi]|uniref:hypothetical protein n=1 Tax=Indioceanicola profundi TaxID=2220096 RepID=UPI000E6AE2B4|nr:hypothetical protein [Indioceanicola profundi]